MTCKNTQLLNPSYWTVQTTLLFTIHHHIDDELWDFLSPYYQYLFPFPIYPSAGVITFSHPLLFTLLRYVSSSSWQEREREMSCCERRTFTFNFRANKGSSLFSFFLIPLFYYVAFSPCWVSLQRGEILQAAVQCCIFLSPSSLFVLLTRRYTRIESL